MLALLPAGHRHAGAGEVPLSELRDEGWIVGAPDPTSSVIVAACQRAGFEPRVAFETDDALTTQSLIAAGLGVSLASPWVERARRDDVVLVPLAEPVPTRRLQAAVPDRRAGVWACCRSWPRAPPARRACPPDQAAVGRTSESTRRVAAERPRRCAGTTSTR